MLAIWRDHFSTFLVAEGANLDVTIGEIDDDGIDCPPPNQDEVRTAIAELKHDKAAGADGLPAELFKTGGDELIGRMYQLICKIWLDECMPDDWNLSVLCPVFKKGDPSDREERAVKSTPPQKSPPNSHVTCTLSPQESIQEEPEREINEGLPLIQRLQQLKIKHDPPPSAVATEFHLPMSSAPQMTSKVENISISSTSHNNNVSSSLAVAQFKPMMKVSFRQRIQRLQEASESGDMKVAGNSSDVAAERSAPIVVGPKKVPPKSLPVSKFGLIEPEAKGSRKQEVTNKSHKSISTISSKSVKPSTTTPTIVSDMDTPIKPWSKLKLATMISSSYTSLATSNTSSEDVFSPMKNSSVGNIPQYVLREESPKAKSTKPPVPPRKRRDHQDHADPSLKTFIPSVETTIKSYKQDNGTSDAALSSSKFYQSVFDLSPEYNGLPFVKRLKILNERQKLAELEKALQTRSFSLDSSKTTSCVPIPEALYRCHSDTSGINSQFLSVYESSSTTSTNTSTSDTSKCAPIHYYPHHRLGSAPIDYAPLSPESNETLERRKLKSILKRISSEREHRRTSSSKRGDSAGETKLHQKGLSMQPTVEGPPGSVVSANDETLADQPPHTSLPAAMSSSFYNESVVSPPDLMNASQAFQKYSSSTFNMYPTDLYPLTENNHSTCQTHEKSAKGFLEGQDCFNQILCGIDNVIRRHVNEMHSKFESRFSNMAMEVERRDVLIAHLQSKLRSLELHTTSRRKANREKVVGQCAGDNDGDDGNDVAEETSSSDSSAELLFMRGGDSLDTVFTSSPPMQMKRHYTCSPGTGAGRSQDEFTYDYLPYVSTGSVGKPKNGKSKSTNPSVVVSDLTGNFTRLDDSVILDIGESSSSSSSSEKLNVQTEEEHVKGGNDSPRNQIQHNDWEVRMLAAEMEKQERKRGLSLTDISPLTNAKLGSTVLRRRRKLSDTETECSETDAEPPPTPARPRASSLDQFNLRYGIGRGGIFKAMSIDRDKDKL